MELLDEAPTDDALLSLARAGDRAAVGALVRRYRSVVYRFARRLVTDPALAEDVMQETFLAATGSLDTFRGEGSLKAWLLSITRAKAGEARRRKAGEPSSFESAGSLDELGARAGWGHALSPEELAARVEQRTLLERGLSGLSPEEREVVLLRDVEGLSGEQVAAALGLSLAAVKSRLHRGRLRLLALVKQEVLS